jgi:hypothetical protein
MAAVPEGLTDQQHQLLRRVLTSRQFAHADILKRILTYLVDHSTSSVTPPKEYEIAVQAMGRSGTFDPRTDPIVRVSVGSIRERLNAFFGTEGRGEHLRMEIPKGQYRVVFTDAPADLPPTTRQPSALTRFWQPYISGNCANIIVYTEPIFFRDNQGRYFRDWGVNSLESGVAEIRKRFPGLADVEISPVFHYLSAGEMHCLLSITRMFHEIGVPVETRNSRNTTWHELRHANLILLGSPRTNHFLESLQGEYQFVVGHEMITVRDPGTERTFSGTRYKDGRLSRMTEYAVVTRRPGLVEGSWVTMIGANHGRAIEGAGHVLTLEDRVQHILEAMPNPTTAPPPSFQLLMKVETIDLDDEVTAVQCERVTVLP